MDLWKTPRKDRAAYGRRKSLPRRDWPISLRCSLVKPVELGKGKLIIIETCRLKMMQGKRSQRATRWP